MCVYEVKSVCEGCLERRLCVWGEENVSGVKSGRGGVNSVYGEKSVFVGGGVKSVYGVKSVCVWGGEEFVSGMKSVCLG